MKAIKNRSLVINIISAALPVLLGICLVIWPASSANIICYIIGAICTVVGIVRIIGYFCGAARQAYSMDLISGVISAAFGLVLLAFSSRILKVIPILAGIYILIDSLLKLGAAIDIRRLGGRRWYFMLVLALIETLFGLLLIINPFGAVSLAIRIIGIALIINGAENLAVSLFTEKRERERAKNSYEDGKRTFESDDYTETK